MTDHTPSRSPSPSELKLINSRFSRKHLTASDIQVIAPMHMANAYQVAHSRFHLDTASTLEPMAEQINGTLKSDIPLPPVRMFVGHDVHGKVGLGTFFSAEIVDNDRGPVLSGKVYIVKGIDLGGMSSDSLIRAYDAGQWESLSIGQNWSQVVFRCDICGEDLFAEGCDHLLNVAFGMPLDDGSFATVTVMNSRLNETSAVFHGALGDAKAGKLSAEEMAFYAAIGRAEDTDDHALADALFQAKAFACVGMECSCRGVLNGKAFSTATFSHSDTALENRPGWAAWIRENRTFLPDTAFADEEGRMFPHHWVSGGRVGRDGRFVATHGTLRLHQDGVAVSLDAALKLKNTEDVQKHLSEHLTAHQADGGSKALQASVSAVDLAATGTATWAHQLNQSAYVQTVMQSGTGITNTDGPTHPQKEQKMPTHKTKDALLADLAALQERVEELEGLDGTVLATRAQSLANEVDDLTENLDARTAELTELRTAYDALKAEMVSLRAPAEQGSALLSALSKAGFSDFTDTGASRIALDAKAAREQLDAAFAAASAAITDLSGPTGLSEAEAAHYLGLAEHIRDTSMSNLLAASRLATFTEHMKEEHQLLGIQPGRTSAKDSAPADMESADPVETKDREARVARLAGALLTTPAAA